MTAGRPWVIVGHNGLPWALREACGLDLEGVGVRPHLLHRRQCRDGNPPAVDMVHRLVTGHPGALALPTTADEVTAAVASGRVASLLGMEGGHCIGESLGVLRAMHALGVRYMTLTLQRRRAVA